MALTDENNMVMPVAPLYGNNNGFGNFGGDGWWIILLLLACNGGFGGFGGWNGMMGMGMMNGFGLGYDFPWLMAGQQNINSNTTNGFRDAMLNDGITSIRDGISGLSTQMCGGFGDIQTSLCNGFNGVNNSIFGAQAALSQQMNADQLASLERSFAAQTAMTSGINGIQAQISQAGYNTTSGLADLKYTVATENCADRYEAAQNTRDIIESQTRGTQAILDKLCALELDNVKTQLAQAQRENTGLQNAVNMAAFRESQANQNALFAQGLNNEVDALYNRLKNCPVNTVPVFGNQPIFTCSQNVAGSNAGCGCGSF